MFGQTSQDLARRSALPPTILHTADRDIQSSLYGTYNRFEEAANNYLTSVDMYGRRIASYNTQLAAEKSALNIPTQKMNQSLQHAQQDFKNTDGIVFQLQVEIQRNIGACRRRQVDHGTCIENKIYAINNNTEKMSDLETDIENTNTDINQCSRDAEYYDSLARSEKEEENTHDGRAIIGGILIVGVGLILAPFSAFWSLPAAAAGVAVNTGVNVAESREHARRAEEFRDKAKQKRDHVKTLWDKKDGLKKDIQHLQQEVRDLKTKIGELEDAIGRLSMVLEKLNISTQITYCVMDNIKEIIVVLQEAERMGRSFIVIQNGLSRHPEKLEYHSQKMVEKFRTSWSKLENLVVNSPNHIYQNLHAIEQQHYNRSLPTSGYH